MSPFLWLHGWMGTHDRGYVALRRAGRTAIVMPGLFAFCTKVLDNPTVGAFAAFGAFSLLLLVDFVGPTRSRLQAQAALSVTCGLFVCLGTLASRWLWVSAASMAVIAFLVIFAGVVSSVLAGATASLLLSFILSTSLVAPASAIPDRLAGWGLASGAAFLAVWLLWPAPVTNPLRAAAVGACRALANRLRVDVACMTELDRAGSLGRRLADERQAADDEATAAIQAMQRVFLATPWRPTGLSTPARTTVRLVDELLWLNTVVVQATSHAPGLPANPFVGQVRAAAAAVLSAGADLLAEPAGPTAALDAARRELASAVDNMEREDTAHLPIHQRAVAAATTTIGQPPAPVGQDRVEEFISSLDPSFRAQELAFAASRIGANIDLAAAADRRSWVEALLGRQPGALVSPLGAARQRAAAHVERHSVWLHNSLRGAVGLAVAVFIAGDLGVQHAFWVILGTFAVLRSSALNTGQNVLRALAGTVVGFAIGAGLLELVGTNATVLWLVFPVAILVAGFAPAAVSFAAGQAGFTLALVILFNLLQPTGWRVGLLRVEDIALGCAVSLGVGLLFWPRGAAAALGVALDEAYGQSAAYLAAAVNYGMARCDDRLPAPRSPAVEATRAAAASRRLDDTYRTFLAERGSKPRPIAEVATLVAGVANLRQSADAVVDLWGRDDGAPSGDRTVARAELSTRAEQISGWYEDLGASLAGRGHVPDPVRRDRHPDGPLLDAVRHDLRAEEGHATATAVRMIWTGDHLDAAGRLGQSLLDPARAAAAEWGDLARTSWLARRRRAQRARGWPRS